VKRRHNVRQLHSRRNARLLRNVKPRRNARQLRSHNSTLRLRQTKTSTLISCVPQGIRGAIRGCRLPRRALTMPVVDDRKGNRNNNRNKSAPKGVFT
jgi:hypothetical protein